MPAKPVTSAIDTSVELESRFPRSIKGGFQQTSRVCEVEVDLLLWLAIELWRSLLALGGKDAHIGDLKIMYEYGWMI